MMPEATAHIHQQQALRQRRNAWPGQTAAPAEALSALDEPARQRQAELAADGLLQGLTRSQVIAALCGRICRDEHYLAYRKACHRRTSYDTQVEADLRVLALAVCWLEERP
jgi:hypothetical protein